MIAVSENGREEAPLRVLILEDRPEGAELAELQLRGAGCPCVMHRVDTEGAFRAAIEGFRPDVVLCDYRLPKFDGLSALKVAQEVAPELPVIMFTGSVNEETAVSCLKAGADDYVLKDRPARLQTAVKAAVESRRARDEQRKNRAQLQASEERFRRLVETANDAIVSFDSEGTIDFWNPAAVATFGCSHSEAHGKDIFSFLEGDGRETLRRRMRAVADESSGPRLAESLKLTGRRSDGTGFPAETSLSAWRRQDAILYNAIFRDTTERAAARQALEALSAQHELLLSSAGEGIVGLDADGCVTFANPVALSLLGRQADEMLGAPLHPLITESGPQLNLDALSDCPALASLSGGGLIRAEDVFFRKDGAPFKVAFSSTPILEDGRVAGAVLIFEDITARKEQEDALRESEAQYRGLFEHATYGIYRSMPDGTFLAVNPALVEMLAFDSEQDLKSVNLAQDLYLHPEDRAEVLRQAERHESVMRFETQWRKKDGSPITVSLSGRGLRNRKGKLEAFEVLVEDLTERRALENQLRQAQKMEAVGELTGGIAHDFNNALTVIVVNSELMAAALGRGETVELEDVLSNRDTAKRASSIIRKLLSFSRRAELALKPIHLGEVVDDIHLILRTLLPETIDLQLETGDGSGAHVMADSGAIEQMLLNICTNSRDAMPHGGRIFIRVTTERLDEEFCRLHPGLNPGRWVRVECSDTGMGMDAQTLGRIFEPFFTTKPVESGTGLGMAMVYGLTKQQGGYVMVTSGPGEGTTTRLFFPACEDEVAESVKEGAVEVSSL